MRQHRAAILDAVPRESATADAATRQALETLRAEPVRTAILTDIDGTLAPIVERPERAAVPEAARTALVELSKRYGVVGCISGRRAEEARRLVGLDGISYAGNHGLELLLPGEETPRLDPSLPGRERGAAQFVDQLDPQRLSSAGLRREDKGPIQAFHWRGAADQRAAEAQAHEIAAEAGRHGLEPHWGRKVLELRLAGGGGKDTAVAALLAGEEINRVAYAGDDRTDLDAFRRLRELRQSGELEETICVGVSSPEAPPELGEESDLTVEGPAGWLAILESLTE